MFKMSSPSSMPALARNTVGKGGQCECELHVSSLFSTPVLSRNTAGKGGQCVCAVCPARAACLRSCTHARDTAGQGRAVRVCACVCTSLQEGGHQRQKLGLASPSQFGRHGSCSTTLQFGRHGRCSTTSEFGPLPTGPTHVHAASRPYPCAHHASHTDTHTKPPAGRAVGTASRDTARGPLQTPPLAHSLLPAPSPAPSMLRICTLPAAHTPITLLGPAR